MSCMRTLTTGPYGSTETTGVFPTETTGVFPTNYNNWNGPSDGRDRIAGSLEVGTGPKMSEIAQIAGDLLPPGAVKHLSSALSKTVAVSNGDAPTQRALLTVMMVFFTAVRKALSSPPGDDGTRLLTTPTGDVEDVEDGGTRLLTTPTEDVENVNDDVDDDAVFARRVALAKAAASVTAAVKSLNLSNVIEFTNFERGSSFMFTLIWFFYVTGLNHVSATIREHSEYLLPEKSNLTPEKVERILLAGFQSPLRSCRLTCEFFRHLVSAWLEDFELSVSESDATNIEDLVQDLELTGCRLPISGRASASFYLAETRGKINWTPITKLKASIVTMSQKLLVSLHGLPSPKPGGFIRSEVCDAVGREIRNPSDALKVSREMKSKSPLAALLNLVAGIILMMLNTRCPDIGGALLPNTTYFLSVMLAGEGSILLNDLKGLMHNWTFYLTCLLLSAIESMSQDVLEQLNGLVDAHAAYLCEAKNAGADRKRGAVEDLNRTVLLIVLLLLREVEELPDGFARQFLTEFLQKDILGGALKATALEYKRTHPGAMIPGGVRGDRKGAHRSAGSSAPEAPNIFGENEFPALPPRVTIPAESGNRQQKKKIEAASGNRPSKIQATTNPSRGGYE